MKPLVIALVGVSGSGKTTLMEAIEKHFGSDKVETVYELTRPEILGWAKLPLNFDFKKATGSQIGEYDRSRVERQLGREQNIIGTSKKEIIVIEKPAPVLLAYMFSSSRFVSDDLLDHLIYECTMRVKNLYNLIFYLPWDRVRVIADAQTIWNRITKNYGVLQLQDNAMKEVLKWGGAFELNKGVVRVNEIEQAIKKVEEEYESRNKEATASCSR